MRVNDLREIETWQSEGAERPSQGGNGAPAKAADARTKLLDLLSTLEEVALVVGCEAARRGIIGLRRKVEQNRFYLTVVGQFKRGKTSFLNALLGAEILPVAILPLTSVVTVLRYGDQPAGEVVFHSGSRKDIEIATLPEYVTEKYNPRNAKAVNYVEVAYPSEFLRGGLVLADTPGIGSVYTHNTEVTYDFLPQVDAAIFLTSPEPPITNVEIQFLAELAARIPRVFTVVNKTDLLDEAQLREVLDFTRESVPAGVSGGPDSWFAVSAVRALEAKQRGDAEQLAASGFVNLQRKLDEFLSSEKNIVFYISAARNARNWIADIRLMIELQVRAARTPIEELREKLIELDRHFAQTARQRDDGLVLLRNRVAQLSGLVETEAKAFGRSMVEGLRRDLRRRMEGFSGLNRKQQASEMDGYFRTRIEEVFDHWRARFEAQANEHFRQATNRFAAEVNELIAAVRRTAGALFGFSVETFEANEELAELPPCGYFTDRVLDWGLGNAPLLLPPRFFRRYLLRVLLQKADSELERNASRVAFDYKQRINKSLELFLDGMMSKLNETNEGIRRAVNSALDQEQEGSEESEAKLASLEAARARVDRCGELIVRVLAGQSNGTSNSARTKPDQGQEGPVRNQFSEVRGIRAGPAGRET